MQKDDKDFGVVCVGSGSKGNATFIRLGENLLLIDNGFSCKALESRMALRKIDPSQIKAILVTHEHGDHFNGVPALSRKYNIPVWMNTGTSLHKNVEKIKLLNIFNSQQNFEIAGITITPVLVPHDSREACQFTFKYKKQKIGLLTDLGHVSAYVSQEYEACDILLLEFNHDRDLLLNGSYPASLKARVTGNYGHLCNIQATKFLTPTIISKLKYLVAMHLSEKNNCRDLVNKAINSQDLKKDIKVILAEQDDGFDWIFL